MTEKIAEKVTKSEAEWKQQLTPEQYHVAREAGTECAFTGAYWDTKDAGMYHCVCCGAPLFDSRRSSIPARAGPALPSPRGGGVVEHKDVAMAWCGQKSAAPPATPTLGTCSMTVPRRRVCGIA